MILLTTDPGRAIQMNRGAERATGSILLFLHGDTLLPPSAFSKISSVMSDPSVTAGAFSLGIITDNPLIKLIARFTTLRSHLTRTPYGDQAIFIRKELFMRIGGFREIPILEDLELMRRLRKGGYRIRLLRDRVRTSARRWEREGVMMGTLRNWYIKTRYLCGTPPEELVSYYRRYTDPEQ